MDRLLHGCAYFNSDETRKLIAKGHDCIVLTDKCFWKNASDVATSIKTRSMTKNEGASSLKKMIILKTKKKTMISFKICIFYFNNDTIDFIYNVFFYPRPWLSFFYKYLLNEQ